MTDIFHEIDEDLRRERFQLLWGKYRYVALGTVVAVILVTVGVVFWQNWRRAQDEKLGTQYAAAVALSPKNDAQALNAFDALADHGAEGYRLLARFQAAALEARLGQGAKAAASYQAIAADPAVDSAYRDLATLLAAAGEIGTAPDASVITLLQPLTIAPNPWRFSAEELTALAKWHGGDKAGAIKLYQNLADDLDAPQSLRARAAEIIAGDSH